MIDLNHLPLRQEPGPLEPNEVFNWENPEKKKEQLINKASKHKLYK